jgi:hypothetical protein
MEIKETNFTSNFTSKLDKKYSCEFCHFKCYKKGDWTRHILSRKHKKHTEETTDTSNYIKAYTCECGNSYKTKSGLWKHNKTCEYETKNSEKSEEKNLIDSEIVIEENFLTDKQLILELLKQNNDFKQMLVEQNNKIMELAKEGKYITNNNNTTTNNFNLNIFLNEKCKDALDLMDFVEMLQLKINDLEETARLGYAEGISKIFMRGLKQLDIYKRPIHCSDLKREVLYIKDKNVWEKEDDEKKRLVNAIKIIGNKNIKQISEWQKLNPEYRDPESKQNDKYMKLLLNVMSGGTEEEQQNNMNKIIRNVVKEVVIDKTL